MAKEIWKDLTDLLDLPESATVEEVNRAFRAFSKTDHPDFNPNSKQKDKYARVTALMGLMKKGLLSPDSQPEQLVDEEDPFADVKAQKEKIKNEANPIYEPINGKHITIERTINAELAEKGGKLVIPITGAALLASNLVRQKSIAVDIKPKSWGKHQVVLTGKGRPGLFGGKSGDLIISIKSEPLKAPVAPRPAPAPAPTPTPTNDKKTKIRPAVLPKPDFPPKPYPTRSTNFNMAHEDNYPSTVQAVSTVGKVSSAPKRIRFAVLFLIVSVWFLNYVSDNVDKRNSDDASFRICEASNSLHATIFFDKYYNFENPYKAAIYYKYFMDDFDAQDMVAEIENQYPRIQAERFSIIKTAAANLSQAISQNDNSIIGAMNQMQKQCSARGYPWNE
jgi:hypothetical protein